MRPYSDTIKTFRQSSEIFTVTNKNVLSEHSFKKICGTVKKQEVRRRIKNFKSKRIQLADKEMSFNCYIFFRSANVSRFIESRCTCRLSKRRNAPELTAVPYLFSRFCTAANSVTKANSRHCIQFGKGVENNAAIIEMIFKAVFFGFIGESKKALVTYQQNTAIFAFQGKFFKYLRLN